MRLDGFRTCPFNTDPLVRTTLAAADVRDGSKVRPALAPVTDEPVRVGCVKPDDCDAYDHKACRSCVARLAAAKGRASMAQARARRIKIGSAA